MKKPSSPKKKEYVLGTGNDELERLGLQHRIWADATVTAWKRAGIGPGTKVLDVGCGPGHASFDMAQLVTEKGRVLAVDESDEFVTHLNQQAKSRSLPQLKSTKGDAQELTKATNEKFDAIYCRWVLCWLKHPEKALAGMAKTLKPGGRVVIHDYFNWQTMTMGPRSKAIDKMVLAAIGSFNDRGGDIDIGARLPKMLRKAGFKLTHFDVHTRVARGGGLDSTLAWPVSWWRTYGPKLVQMGRLSEKDFAQAAKDLDRLERDPDLFFFCPPLFEFIAEKPS